MNPHQFNMHVVRCLRIEALAVAGIAQASAPVRESKAFAHVLENMPVFLIVGDQIVGDWGWREEAAQCLGSRFPPPAAAPAAPAATVESRMHAFFHCFGGYSPAHTCIDYATLLNLGLDGIVAAIQSAGGGEYRQAMIASVQALQRLIARYERLLEASGQGGLASACAHLVHDRPRTFQEALQLVWFAHLAIGISEGSDASISLGRFDQYALPFYRQDLADGISESELERQFSALVDKLNRYGDAACALNLGGLDEDGRDQCNDLTRLVIRVCKAGRQPAPILTARIHPDFPLDVFDSLIDPALFAIGQPTFYSELNCRAALRERGVPEGDVRRWAVNSCMGLVVEGREVSNMWGAVINFLLPLELALNGGRPFHKEMPFELKTQPVQRPRDFAELQTVFLDYLREITDGCLAASRACTERVRRERPNPYVSAFLGSCAERGQDRLDGGADYCVAIVEAFGLVNAADALYAVKTLVFERRSHALAELVDAARVNFVGRESLLEEIRFLPKYGNANAEVDALAAGLADAFQRVVRRHSDRAICFAPSFHTLNVHVEAGAKFGASLDGRLAGEPLAKNIGTRPGMAAAGITALMRSAAAIDQKPFFGGQALDICIDAGLVGTPEEKRKVQALLQTYFSLGGLQLQVNGLSADTLVEAIENPGRHRDLIVRIGGYSDYFNNLSVDVKKEMTARAAQRIL